MIYQYDGAVSRTSGSAAADAFFDLAAGNTNPQGIADPPVMAREELSAAAEASAEDSMYDFAVLAIVTEFDGLLTSAKKRK